MQARVVDGDNNVFEASLFIKTASIGPLNKNSNEDSSDLKSLFMMQFEFDRPSRYDYIWWLKIIMHDLWT